MENLYPDPPPPRPRTGTRDFAMDAANLLTASRTPFCLLVNEPMSSKVYIMTTFKTREQCDAAMAAIQNFSDENFGPEWTPA